VLAEGNGPRMSIFERVRRRLRGIDHAATPALPLGEALHPVSLAAVAVLLINDWLLKPRLGAWLGPRLHVASGPGISSGSGIGIDSGSGSGFGAHSGIGPELASVVTGKLSDLAGLVFAPIVLSAAIGLAFHLAAWLGAPVDPSLSRRRLVLCTLATGAVFTAVKLVPSAAHLLAAVLSHLGRPAAICLDLTDLLCLPALAIALWIGRDELRRIPLGRPAALHRLSRPALPALADARWAGAPAPRLDALAAAIDRWDVPTLDTLLARDAT
jgi:hypothetical protein